MQEAPTRVPAVVTALVERATAALDGFTVLDGPPVNHALDGDVLAVGVSGPDGSAVDVDVERQEGLGHRYRETFEIHCVISTLSGDSDLPPLRSRCLAALTTMDEALKADRGLGGACDLAGLGPAMRWGQAQTPEGAVCEVAFSVVGRALL